MTPGSAVPRVLWDQEGAGSEVAAALLRWYDEHRRQLPWRSRTPDPYAVLVSEIMLQQTRVDVVVHRFAEFLRAFPTVEALAAATSTEVRAEWSGLGYYRRAENLRRAAQEIVERGEFPSTQSVLEELPGVGEYTSAAVASIAFGEAVPVLDGNVERVLTRLLAVPGNPKHRAVRKTLYRTAASLVDARRPGDSNQALMELGATICTKQQPKCTRCPLRNSCCALATSAVHEYPTPQRKERRRKIEWLQGVSLRDRRDSAAGLKKGSPELLLQKRPDRVSILAGAWMLPTLAMEPREAGLRLGETKAAPLPPARKGEASAVGSFRHSITSTDYEVWLRLNPPARHGKDVDWDDVTEGLTGGEQRWVSLDDFDEHGRWQGKEPLPTSSMLAKAVVEIRRFLARRSQRSVGDRSLLAGPRESGG